MALRRAVLAAFVAFVAAVATVAVRGPRAGAPGARLVSAQELARHAVPGDCWLAIHGGVYDATAYIPRHPAPEAVLTEWCGKEASAAFDGKPHSAAAAALLETLRIGSTR